MTEPTSLLRSAAVVTGLLTASPAWAQGVVGYVGFVAGYRHSFEQEAGGFSAGGIIGGWIGRFDAEIESTWSNDHTFSAVENRQFGRNTTWANLGVTVAGLHTVRLSLTAGPGLGWVKPAGKPSGPNERVPSVGVQETVRLDLAAGRGDFGGLMTFRLGAQQHWQPELINKPDIGFVFTFGMAFGGQAD